MLAFFPFKDRRQVVKIICKRFKKYIRSANWWRIEFVNEKVAAQIHGLLMSYRFKQYHFCVSSYCDDEKALWFTK
jgi:hypothetical protein